MPKVSVVIPLYNKEREVERCIQSVLAQTFTDFEVLVINDGSKDRGPELVRQISDPRLRVIDKPNGGVASARNLGIELAQAELIAFQDADDEWSATQLETLWNLSERYPKAGVYFTAYWTDRGNGWIRSIALPHRYISRDGGTLRNFFKTPLGYWLASAAFRKSVFEKSGGYREMFAEDADLWFRVAAFYPVAYSRKPGIVWHIDASNRRSNEHEQSKAEHDPRKLHESLEFILASQEVPAPVKVDAKAWLATRELKPVINALANNDRKRADSLASRWRSHFGELPATTRIAFHVPAPLLRLLQQLLTNVRKSSVALAYLRARLMQNAAN